jgi:HSP20 family protein
MIKFSLITLTALSVPPMMASAYQVGGFDIFGRPYLVSPRGRSRFGKQFRSNDPCTPRQGGWKNANDCVVDKTFEDLAKELKEDRDRRARMFNEFRGQRRRAPQPLDEDALRQQEEWLNRAFGLAEDVAKGMATSPREVEEAKESIRQTKEFVDSIFGFAQDVSSGGTYATVRSEVVQDNDQTFQVAVDVPGVKADDIDVAVEGARDKLLVIRGKRELRGAKKADAEDGTAANRKEFRKVFALDSSSVIDKISVVLENGVLTVTVPRDTAQETAATIKIPVNKIDDDSTAATEDNQKFELELDLPGVSAANIEISVEGDSDKTLVVTATRQLSEKASDGSLKTKQLSKRFTIDEIVDTTKFTATLSNGVLRVTAPADEKKKEDFIRKIEVTQALESPVDSQAQAAGTENNDDKVEDNDED